VLIPLRHESMRGRKWPYITFALIGINIVAFLLTFGTMESQQPQRAQVRVRVLLLSARHQDLTMSPAAGAYVGTVKKQLGENWDKLLTATAALLQRSGNLSVEADDPADPQQQMDSACQAFETQRQSDRKRSNNR
jgi:hypothetical protein